MNEEFNNETEGDNGTMDRTKEWIQENIRVIVSIMIVVLIAFSVYSYMKRGEESVNVAEKDSDIEKILEDLSSEDEAEVSDSAATDESEATEEGSEEETVTQEEPKKEVKEEAKEEVKEEPKEEVKQETATAQETENSFIESAQAGNGTTHLARRALAHYLEKNPDSSLSPEHKIYIEDYLRKNVGFQGKVHIGTSVEFSKSLIQEAISASKNLNDSQLKNLQKYSANVQF